MCRTGLRSKMRREWEEQEKKISLSQSHDSYSLQGGWLLVNRLVKKSGCPHMMITSDFNK